MVEAIRMGKSWALQAYARNDRRLMWDRYDKGVPLITDTGDTQFRVQFVMPPKREEIDITPPAAPSPYEGHAPDLSRPQLPAPPQRTATEFGIVEEPPSAFDRGDPKGWMR